MQCSKRRCKFTSHTAYNIFVFCHLFLNSAIITELFFNYIIVSTLETKYLIQILNNSTIVSDLETIVSNLETIVSSLDTVISNSAISIQVIKENEIKFSVINKNVKTQN